MTEMGTLSEVIPQEEDAADKEMNTQLNMIGIPELVCLTHAFGDLKYTNSTADLTKGLAYVHVCLILQAGALCFALV